MATTDSLTMRFAAACGLLSQYATRTPGAAPPPFVQQQQQPGTEGGSASNAQQLTIFYGGMVVVLDGCTPEKAAKLISLAAAAAGQGAPNSTPTLVDIPIARNASLRRFLSKRKERATAPAPVPDSEPAVPFERRKEPEPAAKKGKLLGEEAASWLALGSLASMHEH